MAEAANRGVSRPTAEARQDQIFLNRRAFYWTDAQKAADAEDSKTKGVGYKPLPKPVPIAVNDGSITWRVDGKLAGVAALAATSAASGGVRKG
mmetsp:Transcript_20602/g.44838  ORF Transcript_20602/g.44838 Transcript_20602/m.44838 type:complete len:93 (-) Transcript_20602:233-511(-)